MAIVPVLQTTADLNASQVAGAASQLVPSGVVMPFAGSSAPAGWLLCNGQEVSQTTYADLYAVLSTTYNLQTNPTTGAAWAAPAGGNFRVPDYRGSFLRGVGTPSGLDAVTLGGHQAQKTAKNGLSVTNNAVTSGAMNSNASHSHGLALNLNATFVQSGSGAIGSNAGSWNTNSTNIDHTHNFTSNVTLNNGDNETRPINKGVNYIIKV